MTVGKEKSNGKKVRREDVVLVGMCLLMGPGRAAKFLAITKRKLDRLCHARRVPYYELIPTPTGKRRIRFRLNDLQDYRDAAACAVA